MFYLMIKAVIIQTLCCSASAECWSTLLQSAMKKTWITTCTPISRYNNIYSIAAIRWCVFGVLLEILGMECVCMQDDHMIIMKAVVFHEGRESLHRLFNF